MKLQESQEYVWVAQHGPMLVTGRRENADLVLRTMHGVEYVTSPENVRPLTLEILTFYRAESTRRGVWSREQEEWYKIAISVLEKTGTF